MSTYESAYKSLLQGVSQQLPEERLPGQVTSQTNMMSDPTTNLRRRPGVAYLQSWAWPGATSDSVLGWFTDLAGARVHILVNTATGNIRILSETFVEEASLDAGAYLTASDPSRIRAAALGNEFFLCNVEALPNIEFANSMMDPSKSGFFYVVTGAFARTYSVAVVHSGGSITASYTTPSGSAVGDAALTTPEYIATQLANQLAANVTLTVTRDGPYVFVTRANAISVSSSVGTQYMISSNAATVRAVGALPARLPAIGDGFICRIGSGAGAQYYRYAAATTEWLETGEYGSPTGVSNAPISIYWTGTEWALNTDEFEGRLAGDDENNPSHEWAQFGITGMSTYQGRLVLLSGPMVSMSGSGKPRRFYRSTVTSVLSSDPIEIGSGMNSAAAYEWAVPFQKDLLLFSRAYQALVPSGNTAVTPATATVLPTSSHEGDMTSGPIAIGRTLMYCSPRSEDFFGVLEMLPSNFTDAQYVSQDSTPHLPKYLPGRCRFAVSSGVASMALFAPSGDRNSLVVHEYHWDGDQKVQQAWHMWTFEYPIATGYFASDKILLAFVQNGQIVLGSLDPRAGALTIVGERRPFLDLHTNAEIVDRNIVIPDWMLAFDPDIADKLVPIVLTGALAGERVGAQPSIDGLSLDTVLSWPSGMVSIGVPYYSGFVPSPPTVTDYKGEVIHSGKATLLRYLVGTRNSSEFQVTVTDRYSGGEEIDVPTLTWSSPELELERGLFSDQDMAVVPCRTHMRSTAMEVYTEGTGELNVVALEYVGRYNPKIKRR